MWLDELDWGIGMIEGKNLFETYLNVLKTGENLPLFYILLYIAKTLFGYNQMLLTFFTSIIFSFLGVWAVFKICSEFFNKKVRFLTIFLLFTSYAFIVQIAWQLRPYGLLFCFSSWTLYFYLKRLKDESKKIY